MPNLKIYISGLCVLVPRKNQNNEDEITFLFPNAGSEERVKQVLNKKRQTIQMIFRAKVNAKNPTLGNDEKEQLAAELTQMLLSSPILPHETVVVFSQRNRVGPMPSYPLFQDKNRRIYGLLKLNREDLEIDLGGGLTFEKVLLVNPDRKNLLKPDKFSNDLGFVAPMRDSKGELRKVKPALLEPRIDKDNNDLTARFCAKHGKLTIEAFSHETDTKKYYLYELDGYVQPIASLICLTLPFENRVRFQTRNFENGNIQQELELKSFNPDEDIEVELLNTEIPELVGRTISPNDDEAIVNRFIQEYLFLQKVLLSPKYLSTTPYYEPGRTLPIYQGTSPVYLPGENDTSGGNCRPATAGG